MNHYFDITLLPDAEISSSVLMNAIFSKLHKRLCDLKSTGIGVSFPSHGLALGNVLRIHSNEIELTKLHDANWLGGMSGYCKFNNIMLAPVNAQHRVVSRKQSNMTQAKLNRLIKRGTIAPEEIKNYRAKMFAASLDEPYLELESSSNGNKHRRYIQFGELKSEPVVGDFDQFGLSKSATIPWF